MKRNNLNEFNIYLLNIYSPKLSLPPAPPSLPSLSRGEFHKAFVPTAGATCFLSYKHTLFKSFLGKTSKYELHIHFLIYSSKI